MRKVIYLCLAQATIMQHTIGQVVTPVSYNVQGQEYTQNFDGLPAAGTYSLVGKGPFNLSAVPVNGLSLTGWQMMMPGGSNTNAAFLVSTGSSTANGVQSLGASGSTDRALGSLSSASAIYAFGIVLTNNTGIVLNSFKLSFTAEEWRKGGSGNKNTWTFRYKTGIISSIDQPELLAEANLNFSSTISTTGAGSLNGNLPENKTAVSYTVSGIDWKPGEQLLLRWDDADETGSDDACGIDDLRFSAEQVEDIPSVINKPVTDITSRSAKINAIVNDNNAGTGVTIEYDTSLSFHAMVTVDADPSFIDPGTGSIAISQILIGLLPGTNYYYRVKAINRNGTVISTTVHFTTLAELPVVSTTGLGNPTLSSAIFGGNILYDGGATITDKGIQWSFSNPPSLSSTKISAGIGAGNYSQTITGLPAGTTVFARAYAVNTVGTGVGNVISITTQTTVTGFSAIPGGTSNLSGVSFSFRTAQPVNGLSPQHFSLFPDAPVNAAVVGVAGVGSAYTITVSTGDGDGFIKLFFANDTGLSPAIANKPVIASGLYSIDKTPPVIRSVSIPDRSMKIGDTVLVSIGTNPDPSLLRMVNGTIDRFLLNGFTKKNDSSYTAYFIVNTGGVDMAGAANIPVNIVLSDATGNRSIAYQEAIIQNNDLIDVSNPFVKRLRTGLKKLYKAGDTVMIAVLFSETVWLTIGSTQPYLKLTIGNAQRQAVYLSGSGTDSLVFGYTIISTDEDSIGIKINNTITATNTQIRDTAGNLAVLSLPAIPGDALLVDGVAPKVTTVIVPADKTYTTGDTLVFTVLFSEKIRINNSSDTILLKLSVGTSAKNMQCLSLVDDHALLFQYIVQKKDLDKTGISLGSLITNMATTITDMAGNNASLTLKNVNTLVNVKIDAVAPVFVSPDTAKITVCHSSDDIVLTDLLQVADDEKNEKITWTLLRHQWTGDAEYISISTLSNGTKLSPPAIIYHVPTGKTADTLLATISDSINENRKIIVVNTQPDLQNNRIVAYPYICSSSGTNTIKGMLPTGGNEKYEYVWESSALSDTTGYNRISNAGTGKDLLVSKLSVTNWFRRKVISGGCTDTSLPVKITPLKSGIWSGAYSKDWRNINNWCNAVLPDIATDIFIPAEMNNMPILSDTASCKNINIAPGASVLVTGSLRLGGIIQSQPEGVDLQKGKLIAAGNNAQIIPTNALLNKSVDRLLINNINGVILQDTLRINTGLQLVSGSLQTNDKLLLRQNASIDPSAEGNYIYGKVILQHYIPAGKKQFYLIGNPFSTPIGLQMLADSLDLTGKKNDPENDVAPASGNYPFAFFYSTLTALDTIPIDENWRTFNRANPSTDSAWKLFGGIRLWLNGKAGQESDSKAIANENSGSLLTHPVTLMLNGTVNTGGQEMVLQKGGHSGYNLVSNPYISGINARLITRGKSVRNHFWTWNTQQGKAGGYTSIPFVSGELIPRLGAFFVKTTDTMNNQLVFTENCKVQGTYHTNHSFIQELTDEYIALELESDHIFWDRLIIYHSDSAKGAYDLNDAEKFINPDVNFYSISRDAQHLSIDVRPLSNTTIVPIGLKVKEPGEFIIRMQEIVLRNGNTLQLHDKYLDRWIDLRKDSSYSFSVTNDTASYGDNRFEIKSFTEIKNTALYAEKLQVTLNPVPATNEVIVGFSALEKAGTSIQLLNLSGNSVRSVNLGEQVSGKTTLPVNDLLPGIYFIQVRSGKYSVTRKLIKQ